ncbi:hypothetical protein O181_009208 [Austropuccinia psidii MF-1]|uniref:Uncharacterized protein n=1 Tax=Austropuccinia psidii MF-1 TaxID=1389203 RepID=A0A9Q3GJ87_9BASI|nr:hypothetical protein [Austropuccinia psidii MF-1]
MANWPQRHTHFFGQPWPQPSSMAHRPHPGPPGLLSHFHNPCFPGHPTRIGPGFFSALHEPMTHSAIIRPSGTPPLIRRSWGILAPYGIYNPPSIDALRPFLGLNTKREKGHSIWPALAPWVSSISNGQNDPKPHVAQFRPWTTQ